MNRIACLALTATAAAALLAGCERPPVATVQRGFRGLGMEAVVNPRTNEKKFAANAVPEVAAAVPEGGPLASSVYKNVQVLNDLSVAEFSRAMLAMTQWVAPPDQSCNYCHSADMSSDSRYTKVVARRMIQMVRHINSDWKSHVAATGVTCYTCHRGNVVPSQVWFTNPGPARAHGLNADTAGQNMPAPAVGLTSLPYDPFTRFLTHGEEIRVVATDALPGTDRHSIKQTESTYALMMHMSGALGVNCTYCHNSRSFAAWDTSTPQRATAWYGIRLVRDLNSHYLEPLTSTFPAHRLGVTGDVAKVNCATCHQGVFKPLYGVSMLKDYPEFAGPRHYAEPAAQPATVSDTEAAPPTATAQ